MNVDPRSRPSLCAVRVPPCACASDFEIARPRPRPPNRLSNERLPCSNGSKIRCMTSGSIPIPVSRKLMLRTSCGGIGRRDEDLAVLRCELDRILEQVPDDLLKLCRVCGD